MLYNINIHRANIFHFLRWQHRMQENIYIMHFSTESQVFWITLLLHMDMTIRNKAVVELGYFQVIFQTREAQFSKDYTLTWECCLGKES